MKTARRTSSAVRQGLAIVAIDPRLSNMPRVSHALRTLGASSRTTIEQIWPAYALASVLILYGFSWALPDNRYHGVSFHADENAAVLAVSRITFPALNPQWFPWGTALFYQVYFVERSLSLVRVLPYDNFWILTVGRVVSFAYALGAITLIYLIGRKVFDEWTGRLAAITLAVLPALVINGHYFKTDVPMAFWLLAAALAAYELIAKGKLAHVVLLGALTGYATSVKYSAATFVPAGVAAIALSDQRRRPMAWTAYLASIALGFVVGEPRVVLNFTEIVSAVKWVGGLNSTGIPYSAARPPAWLDYPIHVMPYAVTWPMLGLIGVAAIWGAIRGGKRLLPIWAFMLFYYLLMANDNTRLVRYTIPLLPFGALLLAFAASSCRKNAVARWIMIPTVATCLVYAFIFSLSYVQVMAQVDPRVQASEWIERNLPRGVRVPVIRTHYSNLPDFKFMRYADQPIAFSIEELQAAVSPYFVLSEPEARFYREAKQYYPRENQFLDYLGANYSVAARFENSQRLLGVDSKAGDHLAEDWLRPNPQITIYERKRGYVR
jgi:Dolichyl-phosphate-mannose-protein mannosyltransferase